MDALDVISQRLALQSGRLRPIEPDYLSARAILTDLREAGLLPLRADTEGATA